MSKIYGIKLIESVAKVGPEPTPAFGHPSGGGDINEFRDKSLCSPPRRGTRSGGWGRRWQKTTFVSSSIVSIALAFSLGSGLKSLADGAAPEEVVLEEPAGQQFDTKRIGDENASVWLTEDGQRIEYDEATGSWVYQNENENGVDISAPWSRTAKPENILFSSRMAISDLSLLTENDCQTIRIHLFEGGDLVCRRNRLDCNKDGFTWVGTVEGAELSDVSLSVVNDTLSGSIRMPNVGLLQISGNSQDGICVSELRELNKQDMPSLVAHPPVSSRTDDFSKMGMAGKSMAAAATLTTVDLLAVYTTAAKNEAGGTDAAIKARINEAIASVNTCCGNGNVALQFNLVDSREITYTESDIGTDLQRLQGTMDGYMDEVHTLRNSLSPAPDIVCLFRKNYQYAGGIAYQLQLDGLNSGWFEAYAFCVVNQSTAASWLALAHEIGHLCGGGHDPAHSAGYTAPLYPYAHAHLEPGRIIGSTYWGGFQTAIGADSYAPKISYYSNPNVNYTDWSGTYPSGVANTEDNARTLNETKGFVSGLGVNHREITGKVTGIAGMPLTLGSGMKIGVWPNGGYFSGFLKSDGAYWIEVVPGWKSSISPGVYDSNGNYIASSTYTFAPASMTYDNMPWNTANQHFTVYRPEDLGPIGAGINYTISGYAKTSSGQAETNVTLTFSGQGTVTTGPSGFYSKTLPSGWNGSVTATKAGRGFLPYAMNYTKLAKNQVNRDFISYYRTWIPVTYYNCSGTVTAGGLGLSGVTMTFSGSDGTTSTVTTDSSGAYASQLPSGWSGSAAPSRSGYTFNPASRSYSNVTADQVNQNYTATAAATTGAVVVSTGAITIPEGGTAAFQVKLNTKPTANITVNVSRFSGDSDISVSGGASLTFTPANWSTYQTVTLAATEDADTINGAAIIRCSATGWTGKDVNAVEADNDIAISGYVKTSAGIAVSGVTINFSNNGGSAGTDAGGYYSRIVSKGWTGTATPSKSGYTFSPTSKSYSNVTANQVDQNYTATAASTSVAIYGYVKTTSGAAVSGVTLTFSNSGGTTTTDGYGFYSKSVAYGWSGSATPSKSGYTFSPTSKSYSNVTTKQADQNYTATASASSLTISGYVKLSDGKTGVSGATITFSNGGPTAITSWNGYYSANVPYGWSGSVKPYSSDYTFSPASINYSNVTANKSSQNFTAYPSWSKSMPKMPKY